jgi:hypothetical protein
MHQQSYIHTPRMYAHQPHALLASPYKPARSPRISSPIAGPSLHAPMPSYTIPPVLAGPATDTALSTIALPDLTLPDLNLSNIPVPLYTLPSARNTLSLTPMTGGPSKAANSSLPITAVEVQQLVYAVLEFEPYLYTNQERGWVWRKMTDYLHKLGYLCRYGWEAVRNKTDGCIKYHTVSFIHRRCHYSSDVTCRMVISTRTLRARLPRTRQLRSGCRPSLIG